MKLQILLLLTACILLGCNNQSEEQVNDHDHSHDEAGHTHEATKPEVILEKRVGLKI